MSETSFTCIDPNVPLALRSLAADRAAAVRPDNAGTRDEAAGELRRFWGTGMQLRVRFLDSPELAARVMDAAASWTTHANLDLQVVADGPAEIRVTFEGTGNWSALGTDALVPELYPADMPTMCLAEIPIAMSSRRVLRIARHEFGHAIGLVHEHSSPAAGILWDKPYVYAALAQPPNGWSAATVDQNVFYAYSTSTTNFTEFDPDSIMLYSLPPEWTLDRRTFPENIDLSPTDAAFVRRIYPGRV